MSDQDSVIAAVAPEIRAMLDKQAIHEVLLRYCRGIDRLDADLIRSVYHPDGTDNHGLEPDGDAGALFLRHMQHCTRSLHFIANETIELDGDVAHCETYYHAVNYTDHVPNADPAAGYGWGTTDSSKETATVVHSYGRYIDRFERRQGEWRIARRTFLNESSQGDLLTAPSPPQKVSSRSRQDMSYQR